MSRTRLPVFLLLACSVLLSGRSVAGEALPAAADLRTDAQAMRAQRLPMVLYFRSTTCPYCREVEDLYLVPLQKANEKAPRFLLRTVEVSRAQRLTTFNGTRTDYRAFATQQGVTLVPHLRFLGPDGESLAPDLVGLVSRDFYAGELEGSVSSAGEKLRKRATQ